MSVTFVFVSQHISYKNAATTTWHEMFIIQRNFNLRFKENLSRKFNFYQGSVNVDCEVKPQKNKTFLETTIQRR